MLILSTVNILPRCNQFNSSVTDSIEIETLEAKEFLSFTVFWTRAAVKADNPTIVLGGENTTSHQSTNNGWTKFNLFRWLL